MNRENVSKKGRDTGKKRKEKKIAFDVGRLVNKIEIRLRGGRHFALSIVYIMDVLLHIIHDSCLSIFCQQLFKEENKSINSYNYTRISFLIFPHDI